MTQPDPFAPVLYERPNVPASTVTREALLNPRKGWKSSYDPVTDEFAVVQAETGTAHIYRRSSW